MPDFGGAYDRHFQVIRADSPERLDRAYRLRYQVYCVENPFEDPARCPDRREIDGDDDRAVHVLLIHRRSGVAAGTARLILPRLGHGRPLPIERMLGPGEQAAFRRLPLRHTAEVSRFAVSKEFRRRRGEHRYPDAEFHDRGSDLDPDERRLMPHITFGLVSGILGICLEYGITMLAAVMEPGLLRILSRLGLDFAALGPLVEHHGLRQPGVAPLAELIRSSRERAGLLWRYVGPHVAAIAAAPGIAPSLPGPAQIPTGPSFGNWRPPMVAGSTAR